jgi:hypothetical protein
MGLLAAPATQLLTIGWRSVSHGLLVARLPQGYIDGGISAGEDAAEAVLDLLQQKKAKGSSTPRSSSSNKETRLQSSGQEAPRPTSTF